MEEEIAVVADSVKEDIYETKNLRKPQHVADMGRDVTELHYVFGTDYSRRDNLAFIEDDVIVYTVATAVIFENLLVAKKEYVLSVDENGIGCVAVHPSRFVIPDCFLNRSVHRLFWLQKTICCWWEGFATENIYLLIS